MKWRRKKREVGGEDWVGKGNDDGLVREMGWGDGRGGRTVGERGCCAGSRGEKGVEGEQGQ